VSEASELVRDVLDDYGGLTRQSVTQFLHRANDIGGLYRIVGDYPQRKGRSMRASLCIAAARAFGATTRDAVRSAVSLELLHNAFLIHDDIEDESEERRGRPALHRLHGVPSALNAGDALLVLALRPLLGNRQALGPRVAWRIMEETERMVRESVEGQAMELFWRRENTTRLTESDYLSMTLRKTCWYTTIYPCRVGALIGASDTANLDQFVRFGFFLGAAFQIQDDLLNLVGDQKTYGKELEGDLLEGKRTLMLIHLFENANEADRARVTRFMGLPRAEKSERELTWLRDALRDRGCVEYARAVAQSLAGAARHEFGVAFAQAADSRDKRFIEALPYWVLERT
jgi:geranylgeranyl diphosphate synthase type II